MSNIFGVKPLPDKEREELTVELHTLMQKYSSDNALSGCAAVAFALVSVMEIYIKTGAFPPNVVDAVGGAMKDYSRNIIQRDSQVNKNNA